MVAECVTRDCADFIAGLALIFHHLDDAKQRAEVLEIESHKMLPKFIHRALWYTYEEWCVVYTHPLSVARALSLARARKLTALPIVCPLYTCAHFASFTKLATKLTVPLAPRTHPSARTQL